MVRAAGLTPSLPPLPGRNADMALLDHLIHRFIAQITFFEIVPTVLEDLLEDVFLSPTALI